MAEHPKSKSTGGFYHPDASPCSFQAPSNLVAFPSSCVQNTFSRNIPQRLVGGFASRAVWFAMKVLCSIHKLTPHFRSHLLGKSLYKKLDRMQYAFDQSRTGLRP